MNCRQEKGRDLLLRDLHYFMHLIQWFGNPTVGAQTAHHR